MHYLPYYILIIIFSQQYLHFQESMMQKKKNVKIELLVGTVPNNSAIFQVCMNVTLDGLSYSFEVSLNRR